MSKSHHPLLLRQLKRIGIATDGATDGPTDGAPDNAAGQPTAQVALQPEQWDTVLDGISRAYEDADRDRYLMKRALDISSREMRDLYDRLQETQKIAGLGNWSFNRAKRTGEWSEECFRIFGFKPNQSRPSYHTLLKRFIGKDRSLLNNAIREALQHGKGFDVELRLRLPCGSTRWVRLAGQRADHANTGDIRVYGAVMDITQHKLVELRQSIEHTVTLLLADSTTRLPTHVMQQIIQSIGETLGWQCGAFWERDETENAFKRHAQWAVAHPRATRFYADSPDHFTMVPDCTGLIARAVAQSAPVWVEDVQSDERFLKRKDAALASGMRAAFAFPIEAKGEVIGILEFFSHAPQKPDQDILQSGKFIGRQIAQFFQRRRAEAALRESEAHFRALVEQAADGFYVHDVNGRLIDVNQRACDSLGYPRAELLQMRVNDFDTGTSAEDRRMLYARILSGTPAALESQYRRKDGRVFPVEIRISSIHIDGRKHLLALVRDITERKHFQDHIHHLAYHDALTGLPNRAMFSRNLNRALSQAQRQDKQLAVLFIDLDRFKNINDTLGHDNGDRLLQEVTRRLLGCLREGDLVARLGGDEFVVLLENIHDASHVTTVAHKILYAIDKEHLLDSHPLHVTASIGISLFPHDGSDESTLMKHADIAMYRAKAEGKNNYRFYAAQMNVNSFEHLAIETGLRRAVERGEFVLHYQPKVNLHTGNICGIEALIRWNHPELGMVPPDKFIGLAEETGLIVPIGYWVLREICRHYREWQLQGLPPLPIAANLSPRQFNDAALLHEISDTLRSTGMPPELLELEITESMVMYNTEKAVQILVGLRALGIRIAIDDFGIGHSSLSQLKRLPIDIIKIDRSFVQGIATDRADEAITHAIIAMSKNLQITAIAEGVETVEQQDRLRHLGCDEFQGFLFSKPLPAAALTLLLRDNLNSHIMPPAETNREMTIIRSRTH